MIEVRNLTKTYGANTVVKGLNFVIESGKIYGFLGPNGAGKSTTMNMITGCLAPTDGQVLIDGTDIFDDPIDVKKKIGYLPENPPVYPDMTPEEYLVFVAQAKGIKGRELYEQVYSCMEQTNILSMKDRLIKNLSKGYKQRVGIAQAMLGDPKVIILDEPTVGLDPKQITDIRDLIKELGKTRTVILSSHILAEVSAVCDHVMIISQGKLIASDTLENIRLNNSPENKLVLTAKADTVKINKVLSSFMSKIIDCRMAGSTEGEGYTDIELEVMPEFDIREELFFAFAEAKIPLKSLSRAITSLEEIFLSLTEGDYEDDYDEDDDDEDYDDEDDDYDDEDEDDDGEYKPLFSVRR